MLLKIKSFGPWLLANCKIPIPKLARAIGVHLHTLENAMHDNNPTQEMLERIVLVCDADLHYRTPRLTVEAMMRQIEAYEATAPDLRITTTTRNWEETPPLIEPDFEGGGEGYTAWAHARTAFTWQAYRAVFPLVERDIAEANLKTIRFRSNSEGWGGRMYDIYRWNPLDLARPRGAPPISKLVTSPTTPIKEIFLENKRQAALKILGTHDYVKLEDFLTHIRFALNIPNPIRSQTTKQSYRRLLVELGWTYNRELKVWVRPGFTG